MNRKLQLLVGISLMLFMLPASAAGMHIMEGFLPPFWAVSWGTLTIPFVILGYFSIQRRVKDNPKLKMLLALVGAFAFVLSALKIPSVTGSCSHPTGVGLGAILFGPTTMSVLGLIVLIFQALLLAHGGLTTLGANAFSMAVVGPFVAYGTYHLIKKLGGPQWLSIFLAAFLGDLLTYITTSMQLALAFPAETGGIMASFAKFSGIFALTQLPLAISEGILTVVVFNAIASYNHEGLEALQFFSRKEKSHEADC